MRALDPTHRTEQALTRGVAMGGTMRVRKGVTKGSDLGSDHGSDQRMRRVVGVGEREGGDRVVMWPPRAQPPTASWQLLILTRYAYSTVLRIVVQYPLLVRRRGGLVLFLCSYLFGPIPLILPV